MKEKLHQDVVRVGTKAVDHNALTAIEAVAMSVTAILAVTVGTIYANILS